MVTSCGPFRTAKAPLPPPTPMPARIPDQISNTEPAPPPKNLPPPPVIANHPDARPAPTAQMSIPATPTAPPPRPVKKKQNKRVAVAPPPPAASAEPVVEPSAPPAYRLGQLRTPEQREQLRKQTEDLIGVCSAALSAAEGRQLTAMQSEMANRVRAFSQQALQTLETDPGEARNFATKGKTFAEALLAELKK
jgi:hypothetical protein